MVELLVTIAIIAMLMGLLITGVRKAMTSAKQSGQVFEIAKLGTSIEAVKAKSGAYPPCMGALTNGLVTGTMIDRGQRFDRYVRKAFPRCIVTYDDLKASMGTAGGPYAYTYQSSNGARGSLSIQTLDQAEAIVFWLAGFPTPYVNGQPISSRKTIGFNSDPTNPFKLDTSSTTGGTSNIVGRSSPLFDFEEDRLEDFDGDGWLEYSPVDDSPPYVYFDAALYMGKARTTDAIPYFMYPSFGTNAPNTSTTQTAYANMRQMWGTVGPYAAANLQGTAAMQWMNPNTFQIISPGLDGQYGPSSMATSNRIAIPPTGAVYLGGMPGASTTLGIEETDNLANFTDGTIGDVIGK
jgi:type II secretory pathway pseudopilin PulG